MCWAWRSGHKARGLAAEKAGKRAEAETHLCHRLAGAEAERCYKHGGASTTHPPSRTIRIFSSTENRRLVLRRMS